MNAIFAITAAFTALRKKSITDPLYTRLIVHDEWGRERWGWLYRSPERIARPLESGEIFDLIVTDGRRWGEVSIRWVPLFEARYQGDEASIRFARWFLRQGPRVAGGSHISDVTDSNGGDNPDWSLPTWDYLIVRCGSLRNKATGELVSRQPSQEALEWVADPQRFLTTEGNRQRVRSVLSEPDEYGQWYTIRRVFHDGRGSAFVRNRVFAHGPSPRLAAAM